MKILGHDECKLTDDILTTTQPEAVDMQFDNFAKNAKFIQTVSSSQTEKWSKVYQQLKWFNDQQSLLQGDMTSVSTARTGGLLCKKRHIDGDQELR